MAFLSLSLFSYKILKRWGMIKKEAIEQRLAVIDKEIAHTRAAIDHHKAAFDQHTANLNVLSGGRQECLYWLNIACLPDVAKELGIENATLEDAPKEPVSTP